MLDRTQNSARNIPSLDGLRALSIALVLYGHTIGTQFFPVHTAGHFSEELPHLGVQTFFVISGYLITLLLKKEFDGRGRISLPRFYLRRFFRIFPAFYVFVGIMAVVAAAGWVSLTPRDLLHSCTYTVNYQHGPSWHIAHVWSLSTEEQFYLVWPAMLILLGWRWALGVATLVAMFPFVRFAVLRGMPGLQSPLWALPNGIDTICAGCVLAGIRPWLDRCRPYLRFVSSPWVWILVALPLAHITLGANPKAFFLSGFIVAPCLAVFVDRCMRFPGDAFGRVLNLAPARYVGVLSYSIYLWQEPFLSKGSRFFATRFPLNLMFVAIAALASYYIVERPLLAMRAGIERRLDRPRVRSEVANDESREPVCG